MDVTNECIELPSNVESILQKASEDILNHKDGCCFTVHHNEDENNYGSSYENNEIAEFINFDMLGDEGDGLEAFSHLITNTNHKDLTGDRKVLKILLDPG